MSFWGVVVAAGEGTRFGGRKHDLHLLGKPLWQWAVDALRGGGAADIVLVGAVPGGVPGGASRSASVAAGLAHVPRGVAYVLVHDAARPMASVDLIKRVASRLEAGDVAGVIPAIAVRDTLKTIDGDRVVATVDRRRLVAVQTPQGFRADELREVLSGPNVGRATDDAMLIEGAGGVVVTVPGEETNLKLTYPADLAVLEALASAR